MATIEINEDLNEQGNTSTGWNDLITEEQKKRGDYYATQYHIREGEIQDQYAQEWSEIDKLYECRRDKFDGDPDYPNSMIPVILPAIEGQVASMSESRIDFRHVAHTPTHKKYMLTYDAASEYYRRKSRFIQHFKDFMRGYEKHGNAWITVMWEDGFGTSKNKPKGHPRLSYCDIDSVLIDGAIKDFKDLQYARYIIHKIGYVPIYWAREEYGDEYADAILAGYQGADNDNEVSYDDNTTFMLLHVWTRQNDFANLQLIEMDANGLILRESDPEKPYYKYVDNEYPFGIARMMPQSGKFYGFGDGAVLKPIQETINKLTDELELAARFSAQPHIFVDPDARMAEGQITSNPADIIFAKDPKNNILPVPSQGINPVVQQMIAYLLQIAQTSTRFHDVMTGNQQGVSATATQINTQINQGSVGIRDKKTDIAEVMAWADMYALRLCLEKWDRPFWASIGERSAQYVDAENMSSLPAAVPATGSLLDDALASFRESGNTELPLNFQAAEDEEGNTIYTEVDFETKVIIGEAMPRGRTDMYNILLGLSQIQVLNTKTQQVEPLITPARLREFMENILGEKLKTEEEELSESAEVFIQSQLNQLNPISQEGAIQTPQTTGTPENLQATVPQMPNQDSRRVQI